MNEFLKHPIVEGYIKSNNFGRLLSMDFEIVSPGNICYKMPITEAHLATPIAAHGGSVSAMMDAAMGVCALSKVIMEDKVVSTVEMKISFVAPAFKGDVLTANANILKAGKRLVFVEGKITNQEGWLVAFASGTFNAYPSSKAGF
jgi:uncharacterized protein (TIGR00369 family)